MAEHGKRVVVVGATGNVGVALVRALRGHPGIDHVVGVARRPPAADGGYGSSSYGKVSWVGADVVSDDLEPIFDGADAVVNLVWRIQPSHRIGVTHLANVHGSRRVFDAALACKVPTLVHASSVGVYAPGVADGGARLTVDESWPHTGIATSSYSRDKATVEAMLDRLERSHPDVRVVRLRPSLIFQRDAGTEIAHYFLGPLVPRTLLRPRRLPILLLPRELCFQAVHTDDVAAAYIEAILRNVRGAFNIAADPVLDVVRLAQLFHARVVQLPMRALRAIASGSYRLRLQPTAPGWIDMLAQTPLLDTTRARIELDWQPRTAADTALLDLTEGIYEKATGATPALR